KRTVGDTVGVYATVFKDGHDTLAGAVRVRPPGERRFREEPLRPLGNDRWGGAFVVDRPGRWQFSVTAWTDRVATWQDEIRRKSEAGQTDLEGELSEGAALLGRETVTLEEGLAVPAGERRARARLRDPVLARSPVARGASRVVQPPPRRDAQVRREPAQALPGHLQRQLRVRGLAGAVARAPGRHRRLGRARDHGLPRR